MASTGSADNFDAGHPTRVVWFLRNGTWNALVEGRPSAAWIEFRFRLVQGGCTAPTLVDAFFRVLVVFSGAGSFGPCFPMLRFNQICKALCVKKGYGVPFWRKTRNCSGDSMARHYNRDHRSSSENTSIHLLLNANLFFTLLFGHGGHKSTAQIGKSQQLTDSLFFCWEKKVLKKRNMSSLPLYGIDKEIGTQSLPGLYSIK